MKPLIAVLALVAIAFPAGASAMPQDPPRARESAPVIAPHLPAIGTDVAAPDQQSTIVASAPASATTGSGFDWGDAGIGAGGAMFLLVVSLASTLTFRRRRIRRASALAG